MTATWWGALTGSILGLGLLSITGWIRARRAVGILERIAPFVGDSPWRPQPSMLDIFRVLVPWRGSRGQRSPLSDRASWVFSGAAVGVLIGLVSATTGGSVLALIVMSLLGGSSGWLLEDQLSSLRRKRRSRRIEEQVPDVAELLAFAVAAGDAVVAAMNRVASSMAGPLVQELGVACDDIRLGSSLEAALRSLQQRCDVRALDQLVESLLVAIERGTPLASVLRAQAADARARQRQRLIEIAGRKDVAMLVPVVFLVLPIVVVIALYPGLQGLHMVIP